MILLTAEELTKELTEWHVIDGAGEHPNEMCLVFVIAKAQAKKLWNYLKEPCDNHFIQNNLQTAMTVSMADLYQKNSFLFYKHRKDCPDCCADIEGELG